jgi:hypothetical protein
MLLPRYPILNISRMNRNPAAATRMSYINIMDSRGPFASCNRTDAKTGRAFCFRAYIDIMDSRGLFASRNRTDVKTGCAGCVRDSEDDGRRRACGGAASRAGGDSGAVGAAGNDSGTVLGTDAPEQPCPADELATWDRHTGLHFSPCFRSPFLS